MHIKFSLLIEHYPRNTGLHFCFLNEFLTANGPELKCFFQTTKQMLVCSFCYVQLERPSNCFFERWFGECVHFFFLIFALSLFKLHSSPDVLISLAEGTACRTKKKTKTKTTKNLWSRIREIEALKSLNVFLLL